MSHKPEDPNDLNEEQLIDAAITLVGATQTGDLELTYRTMDAMLRHLDNQSVKLILWKFASEIGMAVRRANPNVPWPELSEGLRQHWRDEGTTFGDPTT